MRWQLQNYYIGGDIVDEVLLIEIFVILKFQAKLMYLMVIMCMCRKAAAYEQAATCHADIPLHTGATVRGTMVWALSWLGACAACLSVPDFGLGLAFHVPPGLSPLRHWVLGSPGPRVGAASFFFLSLFPFDFFVVSLSFLSSSKSSEPTSTFRLHTRPVQ